MDGQQLVVVGSPEWDAITERRAELIRLKNREGLSPAEAEEYARLHEMSLRSIQVTFPGPLSETESQQS